MSAFVAASATDASVVGSNAACGGEHGGASGDTRAGRDGLGSRCAGPAAESGGSGSKIEVYGAAGTATRVDKGAGRILQSCGEVVGAKLRPLPK